jgi:hypothetical protein
MMSLERFQSPQRVHGGRIGERSHTPSCDPLGRTTFQFVFLLQEEFYCPCGYKYSQTLCGVLVCNSETEQGTAFESRKGLRFKRRRSPQFLGRLKFDSAPPLEMNWVAPHLTGGLGNRLFQYAAAAGLAEKWNREVVFFLPRCGETSHGEFSNIFKLFPQTRIVESASDWETLLEPQSSMYRYHPFSDTPVQGNSVIQGWRQTEKYFPKGGISLNFENALGKDRVASLIRVNPENTWFLHVRLGDYKILPHHQVDLRKYYIQCLLQIPRGSTLCFFSDEPELCAEAFRGPCAQLGLNYEVFGSKDELESLFAMSQCKGGAITANSTFSWWGSYLAHQGASSNFRAFYPTQWGKKMPPPVDIIPAWGTAMDIEE